MPCQKSNKTMNHKILAYIIITAGILLILIWMAWVEKQCCWSWKSAAKTVLITFFMAIGLVLIVGIVTYAAQYLLRN